MNCGESLLELKHVTNENIHTFEIPKSKTHLKIRGRLDHFKAPDHISYLNISKTWLKTIELNDKLEFLHCYSNKLKTLELPANILVVDVGRNELENITAREPLTNLLRLDISYNKFKHFDLKLPLNTMEYFYMGGNPDIKIKYLDFLFLCDEYNVCYDLVDGDCQHILGDGKLMYNLDVRRRVEQHSYQGKKYIDVSKY